MKIRVLHCMETIASGGVEQTVLTLIKGLDKDKYEHKIVCTWYGGPVAEELTKLGVELIMVGGMKHPFEWSKHKRVFQTILSFKPHIVHGAVFEGMGMASISGYLTRVPVIILEETSDPQNRSKKANWLLRRYVQVADKIMSISPSVAEYLQKVAKINPSKISLIPNGVSLPDFPNKSEIRQEKEKLGISEEKFVIGFVGRIFNDHKRLTDLIEAVALLKTDNWLLLVIGDGPDRASIEDLVDKTGIINKVKFLGYKSNTSLYYSIMDVFCIPSAREGFGLVAVEAMLHKLPVIASKVGGLANIVVDEETGFLVSHNNPKAIANKTQLLINNPILRDKLGKAGYLRAKEHYTADRYCQEIEKLYLSLLNSKGIKVS